MGDTLRNQIMDFIETKLLTIKKADGFRTDIGLNVFRWKVDKWAEKEMPGVTFANPNDDMTDFKGRPAAVPGERGGVFENFMRVEFVIAAGIAGSDKTAKEVMKLADDAQADIEDIIRKNDKWNNLAQNTRPASVGFEIAKADKVYGGSRMAVIIYFTTLAFQPDTQG